MNIICDDTNDDDNNLVRKYYSELFLQNYYV